MSIESFIQAMPKVELHIHLEGAMQRETLLMIAEQNEINTTLKHFRDWVKLLDRPDYPKLDQLIQTTSLWLLYPEDVTRVVYDLGVMLSKQNVRYAEISVTPTLYMQNGMSFEELLAALNDGRDRVERGWGVRMGWILIVPRNEPRKADDIARWANSAAGRKGGVLAMGLSGREDSQPVGQFERSFRNAEKKGLPRVCHAGEVLGAEGVLETLQQLEPDRLAVGWGAADAPDVVKLLVEKPVPLDVSLAWALCYGKVAKYADYPLRHLYDDGVKLTIGADMPSLYKTTLNDEYLAVVEHCGFEIQELEELALNAVEFSLMSSDEKATMLAAFKEEYAQLRTTHITPVP